MNIVQSGTLAEGSREQFKAWIADKLQVAHVPELPRERAMEMAERVLLSAEEDGPFGHPDFSWREADAHDLAQVSEIDYWDAAA